MNRKNKRDKKFFGKIGVYSVFAAGVIVCGVFFGVFFWGGKEKHETPPSSRITGNPCVFSEKSHTQTFFEEAYFWKHFEEAEEKFPEARGVIIPHHLLPGEVISGTLGAIASKEVQTVILIGPNHYERGNNHILTETASWETSFGTLLPSRDVCALLEKPYAGEDFDILHGEHAIAGVVPYVKYFFPRAEIVPIVVSRKITKAQKQDVVRFLAERASNPATRIIAAVDFSHNLVSEEAAVNNGETLETMQRRDYGKLVSYGNEYVDSPESIELLLRAMDASGNSEMRVLYDTNSGLLTKNPYASATSYFGIILSKAIQE